MTTEGARGRSPRNGARRAIRIFGAMSARPSCSDPQDPDLSLLDRSAELNDDCQVKRRLASSRTPHVRPASFGFLVGVLVVACGSVEGDVPSDAGADGDARSDPAPHRDAARGGSSPRDSGDGGAGGYAGVGAAGTDSGRLDAGSGYGGASDGGRDAAPDVSAPGGGTGEAGPETGGGPPEPCATARFCDHFESYPEGSPPGGMWKIDTKLGAVTVVTEQHFGGGKAVKFTTPASSDSKTAYMRLAESVFPIPGNAYYGRMMFLLESAPAASVHWTFIQAGGVVQGQNYHALYRYGGQQPVPLEGSVGNQLMANYDTPDSYSGIGPASDCWFHADKVVVPVARWTCAEWLFDGQNDTMRFWLDGVAVDSLTMQHTGQGCVAQPAAYEWQAPNFADLELGWESYMPDGERTLYVDDVVISTERVGCPSP
jgi:hypothetical protein